MLYNPCFFLQESENCCEIIYHSGAKYCGFEEIEIETCLMIFREYLFASTYNYDIGSHLCAWDNHAIRVRYIRDVSIVS
jgi:hypothetical protein